jgi:hypothetical protein
MLTAPEASSTAGRRSVSAVDGIDGRPDRLKTTIGKRRLSGPTREGWAAHRCFSEKVQLNPGNEPPNRNPFQHIREHIQGDKND